MMNRVRVAVGVVQNNMGQILIAKRPAHLHQGNKWEFPGGKVEADETVFAALCREFKEEVNLTINTSVPLLKLDFDYPDKKVQLDVHMVKDFSGHAQGIENQEIRWVTLQELNQFDFPSANREIINRLINN